MAVAGGRGCEFSPSPSAPSRTLHTSSPQSINDRIVQNFFRHRSPWRPIAAGALAAAVIAMAGCRKERNEPPRVEILLPAEGHVLAVPDTLLVHAHVSDDRAVESVWFALTDDNGVPVAPAEMRTLGHAGGDVYAALPVVAPTTPGGTFTLVVRASDGQESRSAFRDVTVLPEPLRLRALYLVPPAGTAPATIVRIDSAGHISDFTTLADIDGGAVSSAQQYVVFAGGTTAPMTAYATQGAGGWQAGNQNGTGAPYFLGLRHDPADGRFYVGTNDGFVRGYLPHGQQVFTAHLGEYFRSYRTAVVGGHLVSAQDHIGQPQDRLAHLAMPSGAALGAFPLDVHAVHLDARGTDHVLVFGERDGQGVVQERHVELGGVYEMRVFNEGPVRAVQRLGTDAWAVALPGRIVRFTYSTNGIAVLLDGPTADALAYEAATGTLYAATGAQLLRIDPNTGALLGTMSVPGPVGTILPLLNR